MKKKIMFIIRMSLKSELILFRTNDMLVTIKKKSTIATHNKQIYTCKSILLV